VLELGAGQALTLGPLRPHHSLFQRWKPCESEQTPGCRRRERRSVAVLFLFQKQERVLSR
jgi:transcriptional regulator with XRE-family HTH domain